MATIYRVVELRESERSKSGTRKVIRGVYLKPERAEGVRKNLVDREIEERAPIVPLFDPKEAAAHLARRTERANNQFLMQEIEVPLSKEDLKEGRTYRSKKPRPMLFDRDKAYDDRTIIHMGFDTVQYDSDLVRTGRRYPTVTIAEFLAWAKEDVTRFWTSNEDGMG